MKKTYNLLLLVLLYSCAPKYELKYSREIVLQNNNNINLSVGFKTISDEYKIKKKLKEAIALDRYICDRNKLTISYVKYATCRIYSNLINNALIDEKASASMNIKLGFEFTTPQDRLNKTFRILNKYTLAVIPFIEKEKISVKMLIVSTNKATEFEFKRLITKYQFLPNNIFVFLQELEREEDYLDLIIDDITKEIIDELNKIKTT